MKKLYYSLAALLFIAAGCSNNDFVETSLPIAQVQTKTITTINATMENAETRAQLINGKQVVWQDWDNIGVFSNQTSEVSSYGILSGVGNTSATFGGNQVDGSTFYAFYPFWNGDIQVDLDNKTFIMNYGGWDSKVGKEFDEKMSNMIPMMAKSTDNNMQFKQLAGILHFSITGDYQVASINVRGNNNEIFGEKLRINFASEEPVVESFSDNEYPNTRIGIWFGSDEGPLQLTDTPTDIYFIIPPMTFENGLTLEINKLDSIKNGGWYTSRILEKSTDKKVEVGRGVVKNFPTFDVNQTINETYQKQHDALVEFYNSLNGNNWIEKNNWCSDRPLNEWYGLWVENGLVKGISLSNNNLEGAIPAELGNISTLENLELSWNSITSFPENISLPQMRWVMLAGNLMSGPLPESFANMPVLQNLHLDNNQFVGEIPNSYFTNLTNLDVLLLNDNKLTGTITYELQATPMWQHATQKNVAHQQDGYGISIEDAVMEIHLNKHELTLLIGDEANLSVTAVLPEDVSNKDVEWGISWMDGDEDDPVFTVDENGKVTALREGEGDIRVRAADNNGAEAYCHVTVIDGTM